MSGSVECTIHHLTTKLSFDWLVLANIIHICQLGSVLPLSKKTKAPADTPEHRCILGKMIRETTNGIMFHKAFIFVPEKKKGHFDSDNLLFTSNNVTSSRQLQPVVFCALSRMQVKP